MLSTEATLPLSLWRCLPANVLLAEAYNNNSHNDEKRPGENSAADGRRFRCRWWHGPAAMPAKSLLSRRASRVGDPNLLRIDRH